ncbi:hypothetical protein Aduo_000141 [Ancylostoma duodenale]
MEEEEDDSRGEESLQNDAAEKTRASTHVSPVPAVNHHENVESQNDADDEEAPDTSQSIDHGEQRSRSSSRDRSCLNDSQRSEDHPPPVCRNGVLDLSRRGLSGIDRKYRKDYANVRKLIISTNRFQNVSGLDMFRNCLLVDATDNQLHKLSSFLPLAKQLKALLLSNNGIKNIDNLRSFVSLENLDLSCNDIEVIPSTLDNRRLSRIDLSSNSLTSLPDLSKLTSLTHLDVSSNQVSSFKTAVFPGSLLTLNVSSNNINDLTEFMRLLPLEKLESISLANNPCVSNITFDYRIYVLSVLPSLQDIDCFVVSEEEQLKGEWLYSQGKGRAFKPDTGAHLSLVKYLEKYCPFDVEGKLVSSLDQSVVKAMEKRREMLSSSAYEDDSSHSLSLHSPYRAWTAQLEGKENQMPSSSADESGASRSISARISASSTPARQPSMTARSSARFEPPSRSSTMESVESSSTVTLVPAAKGHQEEQHCPFSTATTARVDRSGRLYLRERIIQLEQDGETGETHQHQQIQHVEQVDQRRCRDSIGHNQTFERPTARASAGRRSSEFVASQRGHARPRAARPSPVPVVTDISMDMGPRGGHRVQHDESEVLQRLSCLEERVLQLSVQNENLTRINDELSGLLVEMTNKFRSDINSLRAQLAEVSSETRHRPDPCNLRVAREMSDGCYEIIWDMPLVQCYKVLTNGVESGIVRAPNNAARISDVEPGTELRVQVQAIHFDGRLGEPSNSLVIRRSER